MMKNLLVPANNRCDRLVFNNTILAISGIKEGSKKESRRNDGTVERIFKQLYESSDSPFYHKLCWEHRTCIIHRWGNGGQERDKIVRELDQEPPVFPDLRWISACIGMKDLIPGVIEYPPTVSGDPPRAKTADEMIY